MIVSILTKLLVPAPAFLCVDFPRIDAMVGPSIVSVLWIFLDNNKQLRMLLLSRNSLNFSVDGNPRVCCKIRAC